MKISVSGKNYKFSFSLSLSVLATVVSICSALYLIYEAFPDQRELLFPSITAIIAVIAGAYSSYFANAIRATFRAKRVFISYAYEDEKIAREISTYLNNRGVRTWLDHEHLSVGSSIEDQINWALKQSDVFVTLISKEQSRWAAFELGRAIEKKLRIIPVKISKDMEVPFEISKFFYIDISSNKDAGIQKLLSVIADEKKR